MLLCDDMGTNIRPELVAPRFGAPGLAASGLGVSELGVSGFFCQDLLVIDNESSLGHLTLG